MDQLAVINSQLARMRGMTRFYHKRFFADTRNVTITTLALFVIGWAGIPHAFLLVPVVALVGANQTAFDASYLYFARHYAAALEGRINEQLGRKWLVGAQLEDAYLFPLNDPKVVTVTTTGFTWFGWITTFYTVAGVVAFGVGVALGWETLTASGTGWIVFYVGTLGALTLGSLVAGIWWFVGGEGERRLGSVLDDLGATGTSES